MVAKKTALDKDLKWQRRMDAGAGETASLSAKLGLALVFLLACSAFVAFHMGGLPQSGFLIAAAVIGGYMALNIGANDVANAVGPLAAIVQVSQSGDFTHDFSIPFWVMVIGAFGISFGLFLFGPKLIRMVGSQITKLNPMRAYCVALSAAITVIVASWLGLPVSSTHIAVGGVFGVGFYREWDAERRLRNARAAMPDRPAYSVEERRRRKLVRRSHFMTIIAAWIITVPAAALLSALIFYGLVTVVGAG